MARIQLGGTAVVCCVHGREKRAIVEQPFDPRTQTPVVCLCCENLFLTAGEATLCPMCDPLKETR